MTSHMNLAALLAAMAMTTPASADTNADIAVRWGLPGVWRNDCAKRPSREEVTFRYIVRSGRLLLEREFGDGKHASAVTYADLTDDGSLELTIAFPAPEGPGLETRVLVLKRLNAGQLLVWSSRTIGTDQYTIKDGQFTDANPARPLLTRCSKYGDN